MNMSSNKRLCLVLFPTTLLACALAACSSGSELSGEAETTGTELIDGIDDSAETVVTDETVDSIDSIVTDAAASSAGVLCDWVDVTFNASESVNANSESSWTCSDTDRLLSANGLPDHDVGIFPNQANPNTIAALEVSARLTLNPVLADTTSILGGPAGPQGYVLNGVKIDAGTGGSCEDFGESCSGGNNSGNWNLEALGHSSFDFGADENNGHVQPGGAYHYHGMPEGFIEKQGGNSTNVTQIGWAADGFPIYARYGYSVADDASSDIVSMTGSYRLVTEIADTRPPVDVYEMGTFEQDWEYVEGLGELDECNGRFGVTPEFPGGIYHYYATDSYPYFQRCVNGEIEAVAGPGGRAISR